MFSLTSFSRNLYFFRVFPPARVYYSFIIIVIVIVIVAVGVVAYLFNGVFQNNLYKGNVRMWKYSHLPDM